MAWIYRAVRYAIIDAARAQSRRQKRERSFAVARADWFERSPTDGLDAVEAQAALAQLPADAREVVLRLWGDLGFVAIAQGAGYQRLHRSFAGQGKQAGITGDDWPRYTKEMFEFTEASGVFSYKSTSALDTLAVGIGSMPAASKYYAETRNILLDQVSKLHPRLVLATFYVEQYQIGVDELSKILALPLNQIIQRSEKLPARLIEPGIDTSNGSEFSYRY